MPIVLSTKRLLPVQKKHLLWAGIGLVDYDAVHIKDLKLKLDSTHFENAIFTSQNAVRMAKAKQVHIKYAFCVGEHTAKAVQDIAENIQEVAENAKDLSHIIIEKHNTKAFDFFCSKQRRDELPSALQQHHIQLHEHYVYESVLNPQLFSNPFDAVLCFSPLGVKAYYDNHDYTPVAICIGSTTAQAAKKYTKTYTSTQTTIDSVIIKAMKVINSSP